MAYVLRNANGEIVSVTSDPDMPGAESIASDDPALIRFLEASDIGLIRVIEDVVDLLIERQLICFTDLPLDAQEKLRGRKSVRSRMNSFDLLVTGKDDVI